MQLHIEMEGTEPLWMHNDQLADPLNQYVKLQKPLIAKTPKQKTDQDHEDIARYEFLGGLYFLEYVYIPWRNVKACWRDGAKRTRQGRTLFKAVTCPLSRIPLIYRRADTSKDVVPGQDRDITPDMLWAWGYYTRDSVGVNRGSRTMRTRPAFPIGWQLKFDIILDEEMMNRDDLVKIIDWSGYAEGLADGRSQGNGRFTAQVTDAAKR